MKNFNNKNIENSNKSDVIWRYAVVLVCLLIALLSLYACNDFVEVELPNSQLTADGVFEEKTTANAAMTNIYSKIRDEGLLTGTASGLSHVLGNYADELDFYGNSQNGAVMFYNNSLMASNPDVKRLWDSSYNQIYAANAAIEGVDNAVYLQNTDRDQLKGEALFVRALIHFYLTNVFGDIPYISTTDYVKNQHVEREPVSIIYSSIKADLEEAVQLLPENYVSINRVRPNKYAGHALLARVNLYAGLWEEAANEVSLVLNNINLYSFEQDLDKTFLKESPSTIWQLGPGFSDGNTLESNTFNFTIGPPPLSALSTNFMMAFSTNDLRKDHWTKAVTDGSSTWYHPFKYKYTNTGSSLEHSIIFRLGELYLIRAEARARIGDLSGAMEDLNLIRSRAGLANTTALTQDEILDATLQERRIELFTELGHRFFDLKRINKVQSVLSTVKSGWDANDVLFPIPEMELNLNPNLKPQNPGY